MNVLPMFRPIALAAMALLLASCHGDDPVAPSSEGEIRPLALGNQWIGRWREFPADGSTLPDHYDTTAVTASLSYLDATWWNQGTTESSVTNFNDGLWMIIGHPETDTVVQVYHTLLYPAIVGDTLHGAPRIGNDGHGNPADTSITIVTVEGIDRQITVPAGTFACYQYGTRIVAPNADSATIANTPVTQTDYYAPGAGPIRSDIFEQSAHQGARLARRWELMAYHLTQ